jgi:hypothetical protein
MGDGGIKVIDPDIEVDHLVLTIGFLGPHWWAIAVTRLERQAGTSARIAHEDEAAVTMSDLPPEESPVELRHRPCVGAVDVHSLQPQ